MPFLSLLFSKTEIVQVLSAFSNRWDAPVFQSFMWPFVEHCLFLYWGTQKQTQHPRSGNSTEEEDQLPQLLAVFLWVQLKMPSLYYITITITIAIAITITITII